MALTPPTPDEYGQFLNSEIPETDTEFIEDVLVRATDAFWVFTGITSTPDDPQVARLVRYAILDLSAWLVTQSENRDEINSPFSSERIGSYSYSKMVAAKEDGTSGIYWLDLFFQYLRGASSEYMVASSSSEFVFNPGGATFAEQEAAREMDY